MHTGARFWSVSLLVVLGAACTGCAEASDASDGGAHYASQADVEAGLTGGCEGDEPPIGRLRGLVYTLPVGTRRLPDFDGIRPFEGICMDRLAVAERNGYPGFPGVKQPYQWFAVDLEGTVVVDKPGLLQFRLTSDDGSKLFIDGALVIDNDGYHETRSREGTVVLQPGPHDFHIPYWQGPGPMALVLEAARPGEGYEILRTDRPLEGGAEPASP
jgi:hypothetical protein